MLYRFSCRGCWSLSAGQKPENPPGQVTILLQDRHIFRANSTSPNHFMCISLAWGRKQEHRAETHTDTGENPQTPADFHHESSPAPFSVRPTAPQPHSYSRRVRFVKH